MNSRTKKLLYSLWIILLLATVGYAISEEIDSISKKEDIVQESDDFQLYLSLDHGINQTTHELLVQKKEFGERFYSKISELNSIEFKPITWNNKYLDSDVLKICIENNTDGTIIFQTEIQLKEFNDNEWYRLDCNGTKIDVNTWYNILFLLETETKETGYFDLMCEDIFNDELAHGIEEGQKRDWDIMMKVYGR